MFCIVSNKKHFKWQKRMTQIKNATHFFHFRKLCDMRKKNPEKHAKNLSLLSPIAPLSI